MFKAVPVSYPKRRKKKDELVVNEIQEPVRKTMYDILMENFGALKRVSRPKKDPCLFYKIIEVNCNVIFCGTIFEKY